MAKYLDICIQPIPKKHLAQYRKTTKIIGQLLIKHGALSSSDYVADDKNAITASFPKKIKVKSGEVTIVALAVFKSKVHREQVFKRMMKDPRMEKVMSGPSFLDHKRAVIGGFKLLVEV